MLLELWDTFETQRGTGENTVFRNRTFLRDVAQKKDKITRRHKEMLSRSIVTSAMHEDTHDKHVPTTAGTQLKRKEVRTRRLKILSVTKTSS